MLGKENKAIPIFEFIKQMLGKRAKLFHGKYNVKDVELDKFLSDEEINRFAAYVRQAILSFLVLYLHGESELDKIREKLVNAVLKLEIRDELMQKSNLEEYIIETKRS